MKKYFLIAALSVLAAACAKESQKISVAEKTGPCFMCSVIDSKTTLDEGATSWAAGDRIGIFGGDQANTPYEAEQSGTSVKFSPVSEPADEGENYYAYYPYSESVGSFTSIPVSVPYEQTFSVNAETGRSTSATKPILTGIARESEAVGGVIPLMFHPLRPVLEFGFLGSGTLASVEIELLGENPVDLSEEKFLSGSGTYNISTQSFTPDPSGETNAKLKAVFSGNTTLSSTVPVRIQLLTGCFVAASGLKLTFNFSDGKSSTKTVWTGRTIEMRDNTSHVCKHVYQEVTVPAPAPSFLPDAKRPIYIFGDHNSWHNGWDGNVNTMFPLFKDNSNADNYVYKYIGYLPRGSFKFIPEVKLGTYEAYCNDETHGTLCFDETGNGIAFWNEVAEFKNIVIDVYNLTYSISSYDASAAPVWNSMGVIGTINGWGTDWDMYPITAENNHIWMLDDADVGQSSEGYHCVKFRAEDSWDHAWQNTDDWQTPFGIMTNAPGAADRNIYFGPQAGKYKFIFNDISCHYWVLAK